jgi:imidazolonepropionase-like amidohydrolase
MLVAPFMSLAASSDLRPFPPGSEPQEVIAVRAERLILEPGEELEKGVLILERGRVVAVGKDVVIPNGARILEGAVACAGFVDPWSSLGLDPTSVAEQGSSAGTRTIDALDPWHLPAERDVALRAGVTAARLQVGRGALVSGIGALVQTTPGFEPRVLLEDACVAGSAGLSRGGRVPDVFDRVSEVDRIVGLLDKGLRYRQSQVDFKTEFEKWTKAIAEKLVELEKNFKKAKKDRDKDEKEAKEKGKEFKEKKYKEDKQPRRVRVDVDDEAMARAANGDVPFVVEVHRASEIRRLLEKTQSYSRMRLVIAGATEALVFADELVERSIPVILWPTPMGATRSDEYRAQDPALAGALARSGVRVLIGSGGGSNTHELRYLAALAVAHGMNRSAALNAITRAPAEVFDVSDALGTLQVGRSGDVLLFDGDPLDTSARLLHVVAGGEVIQ